MADWLRLVCRGLVGHSHYKALSNVRNVSQDRRKTIKTITEATERTSK